MCFLMGTILDWINIPVKHFLEQKDAAQERAAVTYGKDVVYMELGTIY